MKTVVNTVTGESAVVKMPVESARLFLSKHPPGQFDTEIDSVIWFRLTLLQQMVALVGFTESICEGTWSGPGWYRTTLVREYSSNWLRLERGNPDADLLSKQLEAEEALKRLRGLDA